MDKTMEGFEDLRSNKNQKARIKVMKGHSRYKQFASEYLYRYVYGQDQASQFQGGSQSAGPNEYLNNNFYVNTIVCLDETEVIGTFLQRNWQTPAGCHSAPIIIFRHNAGVQHSGTDFMFRDNVKQRMIENQQE